MSKDSTAKGREDSELRKMIRENKAQRCLLLKIGITTQCRATYDKVARFFGVRSADRLIELAASEGVTL